MEITAPPRTIAKTITGTATVVAKTTAALPATLTSSADRFVSGEMGADSEIAKFSSLAKSWRNGNSRPATTAADFGVTNLANGNAAGVNPFANAGRGGATVFGKPQGSEAIGFPEHRGGGFQNTGYVRQYKTEAEAKKAFDQAAHKMLHPNEWDLVGPDAAAPKWQLLNLNGSPADKDRAARNGDYLKIDAPGPNFYVQIDRARVGKDLVQFTVVPSKNPESANPKVQHFFDSDSSRTFSLERDGKQVRFVTEGRNERLNMVGEAGIESPLNVLNGLGIKGGLGNAYWEAFAPTLFK